MKILVIGLGSMGKRRIRLLLKKFPECRIAGVDKSRERRQEAEKLYPVVCYEDMETAVLQEKYMCAFICSPPLTHAEITSKCLEYGLAVFSELNLISDRYEENMRLAAEKGLVLFLSSTLLYRKEIQYIGDCVSVLEYPVVYSYHVGQYLPDWHPWEKIEDFFVHDKRTNGCREFFAIELPWIVKTFGKVTEVKVVKGKNTRLNLDYNNYYIVNFIHENGNIGNMIVDVMSREAVRHLEVFSEECYLEWRGTSESLFHKNLETKVLEPVQLYENIDRMTGYNATIIEDQYMDEIEAFMKELKGVRAARYTFNDDMETLEILDRIEA